MAAIGMYGVYYAVANKVDGVVKDYKGHKMMGKAISASFEPSTAEDNPLYANNAVAENDASGASGGTLTVTLDRLNQAAAEDMFGIKLEEVTVEADGSLPEQATGKALKFTGAEVSVPIGMAYIREKQEDGKRMHEVLLYREATASMPNESAQTRGESIEWQTPEITFNVAGRDAKNSPWFEMVTFDSQEAAEAYIRSKFKASEAA